MQVINGPLGPLPPPFTLGKAIFDFKPERAEEKGYLTFQKGELITITGG